MGVTLPYGTASGTTTILGGVGAGYLAQTGVEGSTVWMVVAIVLVMVGASLAFFSRRRNHRDKIATGIS